LSVPQSTVTGYLRIQGLTDEHQILTTFFTGEIIGGPNQKYTFQTKHPGWGATDKTDLQHWARFPAWRPLAKDAKRDINFAYPASVSGENSDTNTRSGQGWWQRENIFMRWKEWFLVPDHRVTSIQGASFEGFYYICFNQVEGRISGIYFHARSEK
jgi:glucose-induced degradation protein 4